jgi:hypothetical protein
MSAFSMCMCMDGVEIPALDSHDPTGTLDVKLMHRNFLTRGQPEFIGTAPDIIIRSTSHELRYFGAVKPLTYESSAHVRLHEEEEWHVAALGTDGEQTRSDSAGMHNILSDVRVFLIRGGFYRGPEITILHAFTLSSSSTTASSSSSTHASASLTASAEGEQGSAVQGANGARGTPDKGKWVPAKDPVSGRTYYWHSITKQSRWRVPKEDGGEADATGRMELPSRPSSDTVSAILEARAQRHGAAGGQEHQEAQGKEGGGGGDPGVDGDGRAGQVGEGEGEALLSGGGWLRGGGLGGEKSVGGMSEGERGKVLLHAAGEEMMQARVALDAGTLAMTRSHLLLVDRYCVLRAGW